MRKPTAVKMLNAAAINAILANDKTFNFLSFSTVAPYNNIINDDIAIKNKKVN